MEFFLGDVTTALQHFRRCVRTIPLIALHPLFRIIEVR
jgi:hypothetical protein